MGVDALNSEKCLVYLGSTPESAAPLKDVASEYHLKAGKVISDMAYRFFSAGDNGISQQIRKLTGVTGTQLIMLDPDDNGAFYTHDGAVTADSVRAFINSFESKCLRESNFRSKLLFGLQQADLRGPARLMKIWPEGQYSFFVR